MFPDLCYSEGVVTVRVRDREASKLLAPAERHHGTLTVGSEKLRGFIVSGGAAPQRPVTVLHGIAQTTPAAPFSERLPRGLLPGTAQDPASSGKDKRRDE